MMKNIKEWIIEYRIILLFALGKLILHLITNTHYGLQRDAYLYLAQSHHPDWGYFSTPPLLAFIIRIHTALWGDSVWAVRLIPTLTGVLSIFLVGWLIKRLKGGIWAQIIGMSAYLLSPAFLRPAVLLQPVILNHFFWLLAAISMLLLIEKQKPVYLLLFIPVLGLGWLNKYSIIFYGFALLAALVISRHRDLLWSKYLPLTILGGMIMIVPNILWQSNHNWPVFQHISELQQTQFVNVDLTGFIMSQIMMHLPALLVWSGGLIFLIFHKDVKKFRLYAWAFLITLILIITLRGKFYYTIAAYTILVVFGGLAWEKWIKRTHYAVGIVLIYIILSTGILILPFSLPVFKPDRMVKYDRWLINRGLDVMLRWEDGEVHELPQDYADMIGWDQLGEKVWNFYNTLDDTIKNRTVIYGENYGHAGSMLYHRPDNVLAGVFSFNDAFMQWVPRHIHVDHVIYVGYSDRLPLYFKELKLIGKVEEPYFRENGVRIYFGSYPTLKLYVDWEETWKNSAGRLVRDFSE